LPIPAERIRDKLVQHFSQLFPGAGAEPTERLQQVVIAGQATRSGTTAVPYATIAPMYQSGHVVLDRSRLESAPRLSDTQLRDDKPDAAWKKQAHRYWDSRNPPSLQ
jgi:hypothetical protein